jgi:hypothetical protein
LFSIYKWNSRRKQKNILPRLKVSVEEKMQIDTKKEAAFVGAAHAAPRSV